MDLPQRFAVSYLAMVIGIPCLAHWMSVNGADYPSNPAWRLISWLQGLALSSLALLVGGALLFALGAFLFAEPSPKKNSTQHFAPAPPAPEALKLQQRETEQCHTERLERQRIEASKRELAAQERKRVIQEHERAKQEEAKRIQEEKQVRTFVAAVDAALEDF